VEGAEPARRPRHRPRLRPLTAGVALLLIGASVAASVAARNVLHDQEHRLLKGQAATASTVLTTAFSSTTAELQSMATVVKIAGPHAQSLPALASPLLAQKGPDGKPVSSVLIVNTSKMPPTIERQLGAPFPKGGLGAAPARTNAIAAAAQCPVACLVSTPVFTASGTRRLGFAGANGGASSGVVVYDETPLGPIAPTPSNGPGFQDVNVVLYTGDHADPSQTIITTNGQTLLGGRTATVTLPVGQSKWTLVVNKRHSLVGHLAEGMPWILLGGGLIAALLLIVVIEVLARRRDKVEQLVAIRTEELSSSLAQLNSAQEQLVRSERLAAIGELASTIGHELRNPLGVITNSLFLLRQRIGPGADERTLRQLATADREIAASTLIVSDLLEFARAREPIPIDVDVSGLIDEVLSVAPPPSAIDVQLATNGDTLVHADRDQLRQVLLNLVTNAYQAMPDGGSLTIHSAASDGRVRVSVADTGSGMDEATKARIFEPFYTTKERGVGLGLAVTRRLVDSHGGSIDVASSPGSGTTFVIDLPAEGPPAKVATGA
jgi:signal transduction histidine kinase